MNINKGQSLHTFHEVYGITVNAFMCIGKFSKSKKNGLLTEAFIERMMLAVTEVNACPVCSYGHTKMALEMGMSLEEIENILSGNYENVPKEELPAVLFAQHYAELRGKYSQESFNSVIEIYGEEKANTILATIRMIMFGNAYGIPWGSFFKRFKGKGDSRSSLGFDLGIVFLSFIFIPLALVHALIKRLLKLN